MSGSIEMPTLGELPSSLPAGVREANIASQANRVTALVGISGGGKSSLADTAAEYAWERYKAITLCCSIDPGGFGNKRLALIRAGIMRIWDPRNHVNFFETMDAASLGGWPETIEDPERGYADPYVKIIMPRRLSYDVVCPQGHVARRFETAQVLQGMIAATFPCETCQLVITTTNLLRVDKSIVKDRRFKGVGLRIFDSLSAMSDQGLILELPSMSAKGDLPVGKSGGSALGSADAVRQGAAVYGTGSEAQVGFMQNRAYGWLMNIRQIPDQLVPPIVTFGVEESKGDLASGGVQVTGPRIAGKARTSAVPGWVGDLLFASHEPEGIVNGTTDGNMVFRLYLTTHVDPRDPKKLPILAKHRGTPLGMPDYLEDKWYPTKEEREQHAWTECSLAKFYRLMEAQQEKLVIDLQQRYPNAPTWAPKDPNAIEAVDEVISVQAPTSAGMAISGVEVVVPQAAVTGGRTLRSRRAVATAMPAPIVGPQVATPVPAGASPTEVVHHVTVPVTVPPASTSTPAVSARPVVEAAPADSATGSVTTTPVTSPVPPVVAETPQVFKDQLAASAVDRGVVVEPAHAAGAVTGLQPPSASAVIPTVSTPVPVAPLTPAPASIAPAASAGPRVVRRPRPPV